MKKLLVLSVLFVTSIMAAQDMDVLKGDFSFLSSINQVNVEFKYDNLKLMNDNLSNDAYVASRVADLNEKNSGVGDSWKKKWYASRELSFQPKFIDLVNIVLKKEDKNLTFSEGLSGAKYTLVVEAVWIYPGYNVMVARQPAKVTTNLKFVETANRNNVILEITSEKAPGDIFGGSFSNEDKIAEGYAKTGKSLAKLILKKAFK
jgi:hypothetical protein